MVKKMFCKPWIFFSRILIAANSAYEIGTPVIGWQLSQQQSIYHQAVVQLIGEVAINFLGGSPFRFKSVLWVFYNDFG